MEMEDKKIDTAAEQALPVLGTLRNLMNQLDTAFKKDER